MAGRKAREDESSPETKARAVAAVRAGLSYRVAAAQFGVSAPTIGRWLKAAPAAAPAPPPAPPAEPEPAEGDDEPADALTATRDAIAAFERSARQAAEVGNHSAAVSARAHASRLLPVLARLERLAHSVGDGVTFSRAEIDAARASLAARVSAIVSRGALRCADCDRALSVRMGRLDHDAAVIAELSKIPT